MSLEFLFVAEPDFTSGAMFLQDSSVAGPFGRLLELALDGANLGGGLSRCGRLRILEDALGIEILGPEYGLIGVDAILLKSSIQVVFAVFAVRHGECRGKQ